MTETNGPQMAQSDAMVNTGGPEKGHPNKLKVPVVSSHSRQQCINFIFRPWLSCFSILVILGFCVVQGSFDACKDHHPLQNTMSRIVFVYFVGETVFKVLTLGFKNYIKYDWHKFDLMILCGEFLSFLLEVFGVHIDVSFAVTPMRLFSRVNELRKLVSILLGIMPMLGNVLLVYAFVVYIFAIVGVQLWAGELRSRCFMPDDMLKIYNNTQRPHYLSVPGERYPFICSLDAHGMRHCEDIPPLRFGKNVCSLSAPHLNPLGLNTNVSGCVNWNAYYNVCRPSGKNPNMGSINFDNIGYAWVAIFQVVTLEGWTDIMYYVMDSHSWWSSFFFIILTILGSFVIMNTCAIVIATHYSAATKTEHGGKVPGSVSFRKLHKMLITWVLHLYCRLRSKLSPSSRFRRDAVIQQPRWWLPIQRKLEQLVTGDIFNRFITTAIFLNILTMAMEHHDQPKMMTYVLRISNYIFTAIFVVEMILKLMALGWTYFQDKSNVFDFSIVIISLWELGAETDSKLSVIRAFRALRFGRLVNFLPYLQRQLMVLKRTIEEASMLCWLLLLVIFLSSIVGMRLFGCKIDSSGIDYSERSVEKFDKRKNFNSLLWSMVTVFQVLTLEDWHYVLFNSMAATSAWAAVYFVVIITLGKNVILNILVGIVVENFQNQPERDRSGPSTSKPPVFVAWIKKVQQWFEERDHWTLCLSPENRLRRFCKALVSNKYFSTGIQIVIILNCISISFERPAIQAGSTERFYLDLATDIFSGIYFLEMVLKISAYGLIFGKESYLRSPWNILDCFLVLTSLGDVAMLLVTTKKTSSLGIFKILRLLRTLRPLRMIEGTPKLRLAVEALVASIKPMGNIILICGIFFFFYGILGVQLFKGKFFYCVGLNVTMIRNKSDCLSSNYEWVLKEYNFDNMIEALISVFVMYSIDGWIDLMYDGLDAVGVDQQPVPNYNISMLVYFISFILMSFILLDMFIGVMVETFYKCQRDQRTGRKPKMNNLIEDKQPVYITQYSKIRLKVYHICTSSVLEYSITTCIILSVVMMGVEHYQEPEYITDILEWGFYILTILLVFEIILKFIAFGFVRFLKVGWNLLDIFIVLVSVISTVLIQLNLSDMIPVNPSIFRVVRVFRLAQVLKTNKIKVLLKTIISTLSQVGNISLLFLFFFFIYAAIGVELFGTLECTPEFPCRGLHRHSNFKNFMLALLTLYKVSTGDKWSDILKDTVGKCMYHDPSCPNYVVWVSPIFFASFVITVQFVLVNLVVAVIMQALDENTTDDPDSLWQDSPIEDHLMPVDSDESE